MRYHEIITEKAVPREANQTSLTTHPHMLDDPKFKQWFGGSKVVDAKGHPLVCYHGSFEEFSEFKHETATRRSYGFNRLGYWFDVHADTPSWFAGHDGKSQKTGSIMPVYLKIENPLIFDSEFLWDEDRDAYMAARVACAKETDETELMKLRRDMDALYDAIMNTRSDGFMRMLKMLPNGAKSSDAEVMAFKKMVMDEGYDGIRLTDTAADFVSRGFKVTDWWLAFDSNQIKSAFGSEFTDSPNIHEGHMVSESIGASPDNIAKAKAFVWKKWQERAQERGEPAPTDLSRSCKFCSLFAKKVFGGKMEGNHDHQFNRINGQIVDLSADSRDICELRDEGIDPYRMDPAFWNNRDHRASMKSCMPRIEAWAKEFAIECASEG